MTFFLWCSLAVAAVAVLTVLIAALTASRPLNSLGKSAVGGFFALAAVNVTGGLTGVSLGLGWLSAAVCTVLGLPGVAMLLFLKTLFML